MTEHLQQQELDLSQTTKAYEKLVALVKNAHHQAVRADELERNLVKELMKLGHACLKDFIDAAGDGNVGTQVDVQNRTAKRSSQKQERRYCSVFGELSIKRYVYLPRQKAKAIAKPLDQKLGLPSGDVSYVLEDWLGNLGADLPFATATNWLKTTLGIDVEPSMAHRRAEKLGEHVEEFNEQRQSIPLRDEREILVASADGKSLPVRTSFEKRLLDELGIKPSKRPAPAKNYPKSKHRHVLGDKKTQSCTAGAFYSIQANKRTAQSVLNGGSSSDAPPTNKRLWAEMNFISEEGVSRGAERVFAALAVERDERDQDRKKKLVCLLDGDRHLRSLCNKYLPGAIEILDLFHVMERLWLAAQCFHREASIEAEQWVGRHLEMLLENKVDAVRGSLKRTLNRGELSPAKLSHLQSVYNYFTTNRDRMQYGSYIKQGLPIGSGVIEGTCKHVIGDRMCRSGMRWEYEGAQRILDLRVTKLNDTWSEFIKFRIKAEQQELYALAV